MSSNVPAVSDEELFMFRFTRREIERTVEALDAAESEYGEDATVAGVRRRLRDALEGR